MASNHGKTDRKKDEVAYTYDLVLKDVAIDDAEMRGRDVLAAIDPVASMQAVGNADLDAVAGQVRDLLRAALDAV